MVRAPKVARARNPFRVPFQNRQGTAWYKQNHASNFRGVPNRLAMQHLESLWDSCMANQYLSCRVGRLWYKKAGRNQLAVGDPFRLKHRSPSSVYRIHWFAQFREKHHMFLQVLDFWEGWCCEYCGPGGCFDCSFCGSSLKDMQGESKTLGKRKPANWFAEDLKKNTFCRQPLCVWSQSVECSNSK